MSLRFMDEGFHEFLGQISIVLGLQGGVDLTHQSGQPLVILVENRHPDGMVLAGPVEEWDLSLRDGSWLGKPHGHSMLSTEFSRGFTKDTLFSKNGHQFRAPRWDRDGVLSQLPTASPSNCRP
jgi:hypothetical protein